MESFKLEVPASDLTSIAFYGAPLVCEAAPEIGCGCRTKPVLSALEQHPAVKLAWLNRSGTVVAVQWNQSLSSIDATRIVKAGFGTEGAPEEVKGENRERLLVELVSGQQWYTARTVDFLSREEAELIAARMVRRLTQHTQITSVDLPQLQCAISCAVRDILIDPKAASVIWRRAALKEAIVDSARAQLTSGAVAALNDILSTQDYRPMADET